jgi:hypothetical protein
MKYGEVNWGQQEALLNKIGGIEGMNNILSGKWIVGEPAKVSKPKRSTTKKTETAIDTIIHIDRAAAVPYPDWVKEVRHPAIERNAPAEYDLSTVQLWRHDGQKDGKSMRGQGIYDYLKREGQLESCLGLADGIAIQQKGVAAFRKVFGNNYVFLWRSVVRGRYGGLYVPYVCVDGGAVVVSWHWLGSDWSSNVPAARFAS